jgi:hypothetical protein
VTCSHLLSVDWSDGAEPDSDLSLKTFLKVSINLIKLWSRFQHLTSTEDTILGRSVKAGLYRIGRLSRPSCTPRGWDPSFPCFSCGRLVQAGYPREELSQQILVTRHLLTQTARLCPRTIQGGCSFCVAKLKCVCWPRGGHSVTTTTSTLQLGGPKATFIWLIWLNHRIC